MFQSHDDDDEWIFDPIIDEILEDYEASKRTHEEAFSDEEEEVQYGGGVAAIPLLDFDLQPVGARRNWRNVLNKQRFEATLRQRRDIALNDNLGQELTHALQRAIEQQIATDNTLTPHSSVHYTMQSSAFTHAFQSATFTVREFEEGSERLDTYLQALAANSTPTKNSPLMTLSPWKPPYAPRDRAVGMENDTDRAVLLYAVS